MRKKNLFKYLTILVVITIAPIYFIAFKLIKTTPTKLNYGENLIFVDNQSDNYGKIELPSHLDFINRYPFVLDCKNEYNKWQWQTALIDSCSLTTHLPSRTNNHQQHKPND